MADEKQLKYLLFLGAERWNTLRGELRTVGQAVDLRQCDLTGQKFSGVDLSEADLTGANLKEVTFENTDLSGANLSAANLSNAKLIRVKISGANLRDSNLHNVEFQATDAEGTNFVGADLTSADLRGVGLKNANLAGANLNNANLKNVDISGADFTAANLSGADLSAATVDDANFDDAIITSRTKGINQLTRPQFEALCMDGPGLPNTGGALEQPETAVTPEVTADDVDPPNLDHAHALTVGYALSIVTPANSALRDFATPNDISEQHRDLFDDLRLTVAQLEQELADVQDENSLLSGENEELRKSIDQALPLWERAWEEFVLKGAGAIGTTAGKAVVFSAGFIAGTLYMSFSSVVPGIDV